MRQATLILILVGCTYDLPMSVENQLRPECYKGCNRPGGPGGLNPAVAP